MINLLSPRAKRDIRAARINVILVQSCVAILALTVIIGIIYGIGFWIVREEKAATLATLASQSAEAKQYDVYRKKADNFKNDLKTAKTVLDNSYSYSEFLLTLARDIPDETLITAIVIGAPTAKTGSTVGSITLSARASTYNKVLELKSSLEASTLFENVNIVSYNRPDDLSALPEGEKKYPFDATISVQLSDAKSIPKVGL